MSFNKYFLAFLFAVSGTARATNELPLFLFEGEPLASPLAVKHFKVLVFPHWGPYTQPQGRESVVSVARIRGQENCSLYPAQMNAQGEWQPAQEVPIKVSKLFEFRAGSKAFLNKKAWLGKCENGFTVVREAKLKSYTYMGEFVVYQNGSRMEVVNQVKPEEYIKGVVPSEVGANWPTEALRTQAIAARTYGWWSVLVRRNQGNFNYDMDDTVFYQAYLGLHAQNAATIDSVESTQNTVMTYQGQVIQSFFSADSGGHTEDAIHVFGDRPYCVSKPETYDLSLQQSDWSKGISLSAITTKLRSEGLISKSESVQAVKLFENDRSASGRAIFLTFETRGAKKSIQVEGKKFRIWFGLRSTLIREILPVMNAQKTPGIQILGRGFGHGVGMSQLGTLQYVQQFNWSHAQILKHYYTGIEFSQFPGQID